MGDVNSGTPNGEGQGFSAEDLTALQQELKQLREQEAANKAAWEAERQKLLKTQEELLKAQDAAFDPIASLSAEERELVDENTLGVFSKVSSAYAKKAQEAATRAAEVAAAKQMGIMRAEFLQATINTPGSGLEDIDSLVNDQKFNAWLQSDDGAAADLVLRQLAVAQVKDVPRLTRRAASLVNKYRERQQPPPDADANTRFSSVSRRPTTSDAFRASAEEVSRQVRALSASRNPADRQKAAELLKQQLLRG